jgi:hypothetical protein
VAARTYSVGLNFGADNAAGGINSALAPTDSAGVPGAKQKFWNNLNANNGSSTGTTIVADQGGVSKDTATTVTWAANGTWTTFGNGELNNYMSGADFTLMHGFLDTGDATRTTVRIENIATNLTAGGYDVYVYIQGGIAARGGGYRITDPTSGAVIKDYVYGRSQAGLREYQPVMDGTSITNWGAGNYIVFRGLNAPAIQVEGTTTDGIGTAGLARAVTTPRAPINAVQLVAPGTAPVVTTPTVALKKVAAGYEIQYTGTLQHSDTANTGYTDVPGATQGGGTFVMPTTGVKKFYRSRN